MLTVKPPIGFTELNMSFMRDLSQGIIMRHGMTKLKMKDYYEIKRQKVKPERRDSNYLKTTFWFCLISFDFLTAQA